ncbi:hypothetical protein [Aquabacter spiritensis]|uniref:Inner membrane protein n=1 Tax=Aquabacter spiritensis TaxID=933073 RepID=A0A4R3M4D4_9HYPH|nr:hypothetical protein [Aquabacter spiritensis]TCT06045.1 hypothetical protein EDC64_103149 [Aquabacter spiritensis]
MASDDPNRQDAAKRDASSSPADIEAAVARLVPEDSPRAAPPDAESAADANAQTVHAAQAPARPDDADDPATIESRTARPDPVAAATLDPPPAAEPVSEPARAPVPQVAGSARRSGPSPWLALPIGAFAGALSAALVGYALIEQGVLKPSGERNLEPLLQRLAAVEARPQPNLSPLEQRLARAEAATAPIADLQRATAAMQGEMAGLKQAAQAIPAATAQVAALGQQVSTLAAQAAEARRRAEEVASAATSFDRAVATVVVLGALKDAVLAGRPFAAELDAARAVLGKSAGSLDPFAAGASSGYAPPAKLAERLVQAEAAPAPAGASSTGSSFLDRIVTSAENLVRVGPAENAAASGPPASLDGVVGAVRSGDLDGALKKIEALPPATRAKLKDIAAEIATRREAATTATALYQQALAAISGKVP